MLLQKNVKNDSCLDFSDGHFKLLHMKICSKIKKLRILGFKWRIDVGPMSIWRRSNFCLDYSITTIIPNTRLYFCVNKHAELILVLSIKVIIDHTGDKHLVLTFVSNICPHGDLEAVINLIKKYFQLFESVFIELAIP